MENPLQKFYRELGEVWLEYIKQLPLEDANIRDPSYIDQKFSNMFMRSEWDEVLLKKSTFESLEECILLNARKTREEMRRGKSITESQSPHALAYAVKYLGYNPRIDFGRLEMGKRTFFKEFLIEDFPKKLREQLYPVEEQHSAEHHQEHS